LLPNEDNKASSSTETSDEQLKEKERESPVEGSESPDGAAVSEGSLDGSHADDRSSDDPEARLRDSDRANKKTRHSSSNTLKSGTGAGCEAT
jgi:hypothetical protein